jgi:two-component system response regulator DevR
MTRDLIRLFLLDDHELVRRGISDLLQSEPDLTVVGEAGTVAEAIERIPEALPDIAILDARLPDGSGIDVCRDVRSSHPGIRCIILTSYDDRDALLAAVLAGADGYLLKEIRGSSLVDGIRKVAGGESLLDPELVEQVKGSLKAAAAPTPSRPDRLSLLTDREREILDLIAEGLTNRQIAAQLFLAEKTVKNYVSGLLAKLGFERRTQAAVYGADLRRG